MGSYVKDEQKKRHVEVVKFKKILVGKLFALDVPCEQCFDEVKWRMFESQSLVKIQHPGNLKGYVN